jgi:hypothetical protein
VFQFALGEINGRAFLVLAQRMGFAAFDATSAEGALAGIVTPGEFALASLEFDGAGGAAEFALGASGT